MFIEKKILFFTWLFTIQSLAINFSNSLYFKFYLQNTTTLKFAHLKAAFFELHDRGVVDAGPLRKDEDGQLVRVVDMLLQPIESYQLLLLVCL